MPAADAPPQAEVLPAGRILAFEEGDHRNVAQLGGKGAGLVRMTAAGLPVPPGFVITTEVCRERQRDGDLPGGFTTAVTSYVRRLEEATGRSFGSGPAPLLISVRSGAPVSMPGMMDTILNLGLNAETAAALARETGDPVFAATVFVRFLRMYGEIVLGADGDGIARAAAPLVAEMRGEVRDETFEELAAACQEALAEDSGARVPSDAGEQLLGAIGAVFDSWNSRRAATYRKFNSIAEDLGTAVVVQAMVFGNLGTPSGTGVAFSRDPLTGEPELFGEFLEGGQGEDVVAGTMTPTKIAVTAKRLPALFAEFDEVARRLEDLYRDVVDIEFTVERGRLYILQVRSAKRTARAALRFAADFLSEGRLSEAEALASVTLAQVRQLARPGFEPAALARAKAEGLLLATGIGASPGQVNGKVCLDPDRAETAAKSGERILLVRPTTSPHDLHGMLAAGGILTSLGGATSHAAVVARALNKPCVVGCERLEIDLEGRAWGTAYNGHFDQTGRATGTVRIRGKAYAIDCVSTMDHSWGPRTERGAPPMCWLGAHFSPDFAMHSIFSFDPAANPLELRLTHGYVLERGEVFGLKAGSGRTARTRDRYADTIELTVVDRTDRTWHLKGKGLTTFPWLCWPNMVGFNVLARWECAGKVGYGELYDFVELPSLTALNWSGAARPSAHPAPIGA